MQNPKNTHRELEFQVACRSSHLRMMDAVWVWPVYVAFAAVHALPSHVEVRISFPVLCASNCLCQRFSLVRCLNRGGKPAFFTGVRELT